MSYLINPYVFAAAAAGGGSPIFFHDKFNPSGTDDDLDGLAPSEVGTQWNEDANSNATVSVVRFDNVQHAGGFMGVASGEFNTRKGYFANPAPGSADQIIECVMGTTPGGVGSEGYFFLFGRMQANGTGYAVRMKDNHFWIVRFDSVTATTLLSATQVTWNGGSLAAGDTVRFTIQGSTLTVDFKPSGGSFSQLAQETDATITAAGNAGFGFGGYGSAAGEMRTNWRIDEVKLETL